jgi:NAD(P)-dependent dehydrogenase (short-subunit alcohol dehydrogenase family)
METNPQTAAPAEINRFGLRRFEGKVAVVAGGASGIGLGIARRFIAEGGSVACGDVSVDALAKLDGELGGAFLGVRTDVHSDADVEALVAAAVERFGGVDVGVNAAALGEGDEILAQETAVWSRQQDLLASGVYRGLRAVAKQLVAQGRGGAIVNVSSVNGSVPARGASAYSSAKAGIEMLTRSAALELGQHGIRVTAIAPGLVDTPFARVTGCFEQPNYGAFMDHTPIGRHGVPEDIAAAALFLASEEGSWITGTTLMVDGGLVNTAFPRFSGGSTFAENEAAKKR